MRKLARLVLFAVVLSAGSAASAWANDVRLENNPVVIFGASQVRLAFTDQNGKAQDMPLQQLSSAALNSLPAGLQQAATSVLMNKKASSYFDQLWAKSSAAVCGDIFTRLGTQITTSGHSAYDINCVPNPTGALTASIQTQWPSEYGFGNITGKRLMLDYWVPFNYATFYVTTGCTCHRGSNTPGCAEDPQFTMLFEVHLYVFFISNPDLPSSGMTLPFNEGHDSLIDVADIEGGDLGGQVNDAAKQWAIDMDTGVAAAALGAEVPGAADIAISTARLLAQWAGIGVAAICNEHVRDEVSASLSVLASSTAGSDSVTLAQQFDALFQNLLAGYSAGLGPFDIVSDSNSNLIFRWTAPTQSKPVLTNLSADANNTPSLFAPTIAADQTQVAPGKQVNLIGNDFDNAYTTRLRIGWTGTPPPGNPVTSKIVYQNQSGGMLFQSQTSQRSFEADGLDSGTTYKFQVTECTPITCAPTSDWFSTATQGLGAEQVLLYLDTPDNVIGNAILTGDGTFTASVTIPNNATPGPHIIYASVGGTGPLGGGIKFVRPMALKSMTVAPSPAHTASTPPTNAIAPNVLPPIEIGVGGSRIVGGGVQTGIIFKPVPVPIRGGQQAQVSITICGAGGCGPSIAQINPATNMPYPGGGVFVQGSPFILKGQDFASNQAVGLYLDAPGTQVIGTAGVNSNGSFQSSFTTYASGNHTLLAIQGTGQNAKQAKLPISIQFAPQ